MIIFSPQSRNDIDDIRSYISQDNPHVAELKAQEIVAKCFMLDRFPNMGRPGRENGTRETLVKPWVIVYRVVGDTIEIVRIWHSRQSRA